MKMTTKGRYALRAMLRLATRDRKTPVSLSQLSDIEEISADYLNQLFFRLRKAGLVRAVRGPAGGFVLSRDPGEISVKEVLDAVGEEIDLPDASSSRCEPSTTGEAQRGPGELWKDVSDHVTGYFEQLTLQKVLDGVARSIIEL